MIVRISSSAVPEANLGAYLEHVESRELVLYQSSAGLKAVWLLERPFVAYIEVLVLSVWNSEESMTDFIEKHPSLDEGKRGYGVISFDARTYSLSASRDGNLRSDCEASES